MTSATEILRRLLDERGVAMRYGISTKTAQRYLRERRETKEDAQ